ncbi:MAG TPA: hypothetical protein VHV10_03700 [Ktedonobacteraceae bacterium]|nr:hypothetical protein [Ktedonobacteraceae bacterium]
MAAQSSASRVSSIATPTESFERFAGLCAIITSISAILYAISFIILHNVLLSALFLMLVGLFSLPVLTAVYERLKEAHAAFALWAFLLSIVGALGSLIHGGYDLANAVNPSAAISAAQANLPNTIDPRGLLTFGLAGLGLFFIAWLIGRDHLFPRALSYLGYLEAVLLIILYLGRLIILDPKNLVIVIPALLSGFVFNPILYIWLGIALLRGRTSSYDE